MKSKYLIGLFVCCLIGMGSLKAEERIVNILHKNYFGFEAGSNGWYFWGTNDYWNVVSEKASDGNFSMRFSYSDLSSVSSSVKAQTGSSENEGSMFEVPAGTHEMTMKIWVEPGTTISSFVMVVKEPWTLYTWQIDTVTPGKWVTLKKEITLNQDISSPWQLVVNGDETGGGTFYLDELSILDEVEFPDLVPNTSSVKTLSADGIDLDQGNYTMRMKVKKEEGSTVKGFHVSLEENNTSLYWDLSKINAGSWIELEQRFEVLQDAKSVGLEIVVPNASIMGGGTGTFYIDDLEIEFYSATSVNTRKRNDNILMYPNPTQGMLYFSGIENVNKISVSNLAGGTLLIKEIEGNIDCLHMDSLLEGFYIVEFQFKDGSTCSKKLILK